MDGWTDGRMDGWTDLPTDTASGRVACPRLKNVTTMSNGLEQNEDGDPKGSAMGNG